MSRNLLLISIAVIIIVLIIRNVVAMKYAQSQESLRSLISLVEVLSLIAVSLTIIFGGIALSLRQKLDKMEQLEKQNMELAIESTKEKADLAIAESENSKLKQREAELKSKEIELELEKLKLSVRDRVIPSDKIPLVEELLRKHNGEKISFSSLSSDIEAVNFMNQLALLFRSYNWFVHTHTPILFGSPQPPGLRVFVNNEKYATKARDIQFILHSLGFESELFLDPKSNIETEVIVGPKPRKIIK